MQNLNDQSIGPNQDGRSVFVRSMRSVCLLFLAHPLAFAAAALCIWLLAQLFVGISRARAEGFEWSFADVAGCSGCILALILVACLAVGRIALALIAGWRGERS